MTVTITDDNFGTEVLESEVPVMLDCWATWCGPCLMIAPAIEQISEEYKGRVKVGKLDVDENQIVSMQLGIRSIPTLLIFKNGEIVDGMIGAGQKKRMTDMLDKVLGVVA